MGRVGAEVALVDVRRRHRLGQAIAARSGVRHESPQVLVLRGGVAVWAADHRDITTEAVAEAVRLFP